MTAPKPEPKFQRKCRKCGETFRMRALAQKYCSPKCAEIRKKCKVCGIDFPAWHSMIQYCSIKCASVDSSKKRMGKNNPGYRNGMAVAGKRTYTGIHLRACAKYRKAFLEKHGYPFCEVCRVNQNGTPKFEVHHIYYASLWPKHKYLHDFRNLIHICIKCHNDFHSGKLKEKFKELEKERGLKELFKDDF